MSNPSPSTRSITVVAAAVASLLVGAGVTYSIMRATQGDRPDVEAASNATPADMGGMPGMPAMGAPVADPAPPGVPVLVSLSSEAIQRAGIVVTPAIAGAGGGAVRVPGVIEPNAYREVVVTPVAPGRLTRVNVQLGEQVRRGQTIAQIYSPQLAEAQTRYLSAQAELDALTQQLRRTERLVEIGAASRQELEGVRATHTARATTIEGARAELVLLGMSTSAITSLSTPSEITSTISVPAPIDGVITERNANVGLNVDPATQLFTVVDLSSVWVVGHLYEKDFRLVRVGTPAQITTSAYPDTVLRGNVSYIDPELSAETRTARVRVEVTNREHRLRLGMFAELQLGDAGGGGSTALVPRDAVQLVADRSVVYIADRAQSGRFIEHQVALGRQVGDHIEVLAGVRPGDDVVAQGSFFVRAERERLNPARPPTAPTVANNNQSESPAVITVKVTEKGFEPERVMAPKAASVRVTFVRTTDATCAKEIAVPSQKITRGLPLGQPVTIAINTERGEVAFSCGMNMFKGMIVTH
jgi:RND family efflux transporter MFP subunit